MFDREHLGAWDLAGRDVTVTISTVRPGSVGGHKGRKKDRKPIISFAKTEKTLCCNVTNAKTIAGMYGPDVREWVGKRITLYPTTTTFGAETVDCIRIRPVVPSGKPRGVKSQPVDAEMRAKQEAAREAAEAELPSFDDDEAGCGADDGEAA
jgi:hypothetical protein